MQRTEEVANKVLAAVRRVRGREGNPSEKGPTDGTVGGRSSAKSLPRKGPKIYEKPFANLITYCNVSWGVGLKLELRAAV